MTAIIRVLFVCVLVLGLSSADDNPKRIVPIDVKTLDGKVVNTSEFSNDTNPILLVFWISFHKNPALELEAIAENYERWQTETGVKVIAVAVDDSRTASKVVTKVAAREWPFEFYLDPTQEFQRAMNVNFIPHTLILNKTGEVVWEKSGYVTGDENEMYEQLKLCSK
jgi:cytochrome c biogenesis protein CcmG, thiol:disulfide interchange protein DsbE